MFGVIDNRYTQSKIYDYTQELKDCRARIKKLKKISTKKFTEVQRYRHDRMIDMELNKKKWLKDKLISMGARPDNRGRPCKEIEDKSDFNKTKMTLKLRSKNVSLLKEVKEKGIIKSIGFFIDYLIEDYIEKNSEELYK